MNYKALFLVTISALACQLVLPGFLLLAQVQPEPPSGTSASGGDVSSPAVVIRAESQQKEGDLYQLSGQAEVIYGSLRLTADRIEYNDATGQIVATGNVHFFHLTEEADLQATRAEYNLPAGAGSFYDVEGSVGAQIRDGSSVLTSTNPFFFTAERVDREGENNYRVVNGPTPRGFFPPRVPPSSRASARGCTAGNFVSGKSRFSISRFCTSRCAGFPGPAAFWSRPSETVPAWGLWLVIPSFGPSIAARTWKWAANT